MLNSLWGKFAQRDIYDWPVTEIIEDVEKFTALCRGDAKYIKHVQVVSEERLLVSYAIQKDSVLDPSPRTNPVLASFVTSYVRLELYKHMRPLQRRVLYHDTDSIIYIHKHGCANPKTGRYLGDLCDELDDNTIKRFVSTGPKSYAYELCKPMADGTREVCKFKGVRIQLKAKQVFSVDSLKSLVDDARKRLAVQQRQFVRTREHKVYTKVFDKQCKLVYDKRKIVGCENHDHSVETRPYGFRSCTTDWLVPARHLADDC
jgi:hypothetical protein